MDIHIPKSQKAYITDLINSGAYNDVDAVLQAALNLHEQAYNHKLKTLRADINAAWDGPFEHFDMDDFLKSKAAQ